MGYLQYLSGWTNLTWIISRIVLPDSVILLSATIKMIRKNYTAASDITYHLFVIFRSIECAANFIICRDRVPILSWLCCGFLEAVGLSVWASIERYSVRYTLYTRNTLYTEETSDPTAMAGTRISNASKYTGKASSLGVGIATQ